MASCYMCVASHKEISAQSKLKQLQKMAANESKTTFKPKYSFGK